VNEGRKKYPGIYETAIVVAVTVLAYPGLSFVIAALLSDAVRWDRIRPPYMGIICGIVMVDAIWTAAIWAAWPIKSVRLRMYFSAIIYMVSVAIPTGLFIERFFHDLA
jgi:hypothetical protein